jgi:hypothetical protein
METLIRIGLIGIGFWVLVYVVGFILVIGAIILAWIADFIEGLK